MTTHIDFQDRATTGELIRRLGNYTRYQGSASAGDTIIRWGCNRNRFAFPDTARVLNKHILLDKYEQGILLAEANVILPKIFHVRTQWDRAGRPQLIRKPRIGQMGRGIALTRTPDFEREDTIFQLYIDKQREFRAMMVGELMAFFMEKHPPANGDVRWNEACGSEWTGVPEDRALRVTVKEIGKRALLALEYDFGAVDLIMDMNGAIQVLEVNSRPEFGEGNAQRFVNALTAYLQR